MKCAAEEFNYSYCADSIAEIRTLNLIRNFVEGKQKYVQYAITASSKPSRQIEDPVASNSAI